MGEEILSDGKITLRAYKDGDINDLYSAVCESIPQISPWMEWCYPEYSIENSREWIESRPEAWEKGISYDFTIIDGNSRTLIGGCGINQIQVNYKTANLGYWIRTSRTRQGIATAATLLLAKFGFTELKLNRIEIVVAEGNASSQRVAEKAGAKREGLLRNRITVNGKIHNAVMFSLIPQDLDI